MLNMEFQGFFPWYLVCERPTSCQSSMVISFLKMTSSPDHFFPSSGPVARGVCNVEGELESLGERISAHILLLTNLACLQGARCIDILSYNDCRLFCHFYCCNAKQPRRLSGFGYHLTKWDLQSELPGGTDPLKFSGVFHMW